MDEQENPLTFFPASTQHCCAARVTSQLAKSCEGAEIMYVPTWFLSLHSVTKSLKGEEITLDSDIS
jgi:hypothetical protein